MVGVLITTVETMLWKVGVFTHFYPPFFKM